MTTGYSVTALLSSERISFAGTYNGVFLSNNNGANWTAVNTGLPNTDISSLAISGTNLFAGIYGHGVFVSTNNGTNWVAANEGLPKYDFDTTKYIPVTCFASFEQSLFAGTFGGVYLSINNGTSWTAANTGLTDTRINTLAVSGTNLFAGTGDEEMWGSSGTGVWKRPLSEMIVPVELTTFSATSNNKEVILNWSTATELNNQGFEVQRKFGSNDFVTIGSVKGHGTTTSPNNYTYVDKLTDAGKYFYRLKQIDYGGKYEYSQTVEVNWSPFTTYKLEQNYPNPFNPTTTIGFGLPASPNPSEGGALVTLKVYDILGNEVKTLVNKEMEAGYHSIDFNASDLPSSVYFYRIQSGNFIDTKKMILLK